MEVSNGRLARYSLAWSDPRVRVWVTRECAIAGACLAPFPPADARCCCIKLHMSAAFSDVVMPSIIVVYYIYIILHVVNHLQLHKTCAGAPQTAKLSCAESACSEGA